MHKLSRMAVTGIVALSSLACANWACSATAFELFKKGDQYVGAEAKGRLIEIRSEKSIGTLTPNIWYVEYFDPNSAGKATEIKFEAGEKTDVSYKGNFLGLAKRPQELPKDKLLVDSDKALQAALSEPLLKNLTLKATRMTLEDLDGVPGWRVEIWAAKLQKPEESVKIGEVCIAADDAKLIRRDLKIKKVD
jgi:hypothetical protein